MEKKRRVGYKRGFFFGLARKIKKKHSRVEHLHIRGWVVKAMFCYSYFVNEIKVCACVCEIYMVLFG
jgi:hypothetical protein